MPARGQTKLRGLSEPLHEKLARADANMAFQSSKIDSARLILRSVQWYSGDHAKHPAWVKLDQALDEFHAMVAKQTEDYKEALRRDA